MVLSTGASGLDGSDFTSTLRVLWLDSVVVLGAGACAGAAAGAAAAVGGACWHPASVKLKAVMAISARNLQEYGFICFVLCSVSAFACRCMAIRSNPRMRRSLSTEFVLFRRCILLRPSIALRNRRALGSPGHACTEGTAATVFGVGTYRASKAGNQGVPAPPLYRPERIVLRSPGPPAGGRQSANPPACAFTPQTSAVTWVRIRSTLPGQKAARVECVAESRQQGAVEPLLMWVARLRWASLSSATSNRMRASSTDFFNPACSASATCHPVAKRSSTAFA